MHCSRVRTLPKAIFVFIKFEIFTIFRFTFFVIFFVFLLGHLVMVSDHPNKVWN